MVAKAQAGRNALLIAPTGGGKTLAGFLPSLIALSQTSSRDRPAGLHTLYISPLKALAVDVERNLLTPIRDMDLPVIAESRTGDTGIARKQRQRLRPPHILLTTPEQLALFCAWEGARGYFQDLRCVIIDEVHALWPSKRGDLLALGLARLQQFAPMMRRVGLSATVSDPDLIRRWLSPRADSSESGGDVDLVLGPPGPAPIVNVLISGGRVPWAGHTAQHAMQEVYDIIAAHRTTLVFVNTRFQAEFAFQELWKLNDANLPIALHHGSLATEQRRKVEAEMAKGRLKAVICTSTLDLGIDWGDVDLVIQLAAPKGASRMVQRIGRANHRLDEPSVALLVPASRFEMLECRAAAEAMIEGGLDESLERTGGLDVLAQHVMGCACSEPFELAALYDEVRGAGPFHGLSWEDFEQVVDFVSSGGYALKAYDRFRRIVKDTDGRWHAPSAETIRRHRLNLGAILSAETLSVRISAKGQRPGRKLGEVEEGALEQLEPGDTFVFAGQVWQLETMTSTDVLVSPAPAREPKLLSWGGSKFPLSTYLAERVRHMIADEPGWSDLPDDVGEWLGMQKRRSKIPRHDEILIETFPRGQRYYLVCYPFDGRISHGTLAMLLSRRLDRLGAGPLGFVCNDYALCLWALKPMDDIDFDELFAEDMLGDDLEAWLEESFMMKRTFKACALIAGLIERRHPGQTKSGRQVTFSTDLIYDVLRRYQPDHLLLRCARTDAASGLLDVARLGRLLKRAHGCLRPVNLDRVSPFAVPMFLEIGRERAPGGAANTMILNEISEDLIAEASR